jgi:hypothetical protein
MNTTRITTVGAGVLLVGGLAGGLAACGGNSGSSAPAGGGTSTSGQAVPAPTTPAPANSPNALQVPTPGPTLYVPVPGPTRYVPVPEPTQYVHGYVPQPAAPSGASCDNSGLFAGQYTSCPFAEHVEAAYWANGGVSGAAVPAYSPVTGITYSMYCTEAGGTVTCTGGNDAVVEFPG